MYFTFLSVSLKAFYNREMDNDTTLPETRFHGISNIN